MRVPVICTALVLFLAAGCEVGPTHYWYQPGKTFTDPIGPAQGQHHVIKGGSWKHASIRNLRAAHRDYQDESRIDLGFRVCRYLSPTEAAQ